MHTQTLAVVLDTSETLDMLRSEVAGAFEDQSQVLGVLSHKLDGLFALVTELAEDAPQRADIDRIVAEIQKLGRWKSPKSCQVYLDMKIVVSSTALPGNLLRL